MFRAHGYAAIAGKAGYTLSCMLAALVLVGSGFAYYVKAQVVSIGGSDAISGGPSVGAMNILLMGLESRTDYDGNILPANLLAALHAGSVQGVEFERRRRPGHQHADPHPHLRGRAEGGGLLDPAR